MTVSMNANEAIRWIHSRRYTGHKNGLENTRALLAPLFPRVVATRVNEPRAAAQRAIEVFPAGGDAQAVHALRQEHREVVKFHTLSPFSSARAAPTR